MYAGAKELPIKRKAQKMSKKKRVNLLLDEEELAKFKQIVQQKFSNLSREFNLYMQAENRKHGVLADE